MRNEANFRQRWAGGITQGGICKTNPIPGCAGRDEGQMRQTNPNLGKLGHRGDGAPGRGQSYKQTQLRRSLNVEVCRLKCRTKPI
jgi:hypothetical protein